MPLFSFGACPFFFIIDTRLKRCTHTREAKMKFLIKERDIKKIVKTLNIKNLASRNAVILDRCMSNLFILSTPV